jgi:predicted permease
MTLMGRLLRRVLFLFHRDRFDREIQEEIRFHIDSTADDEVSGGVTEAAARREALVRFGNQTAIKEEAAAQWSFPLAARIVQDLRFAFRMLARKPAVTVTSIAALALGIGASTAIFIVVRGVLLAPLPFARPDRLVVAWKQGPITSPPLLELSIAEFKDWKQQSRSFEDLTAMPTTVYGYGFTVTGHGDPFQVESARVSASFFSTLGVRPAVGQPFTDEQDHPGGQPVVVISNRLWAGKFNSDPGLIGQQLILGGTGYTVLGVMPADFDFPHGADIWAPLSTNRAMVENRGAVFLQVVGRLKPGVTPEIAREELTALIARLADQYGDPHADLKAVVTPLPEYVFGKSGPVLRLLMAAALLLLIIAWANVATVITASTASRSQEIAVRAALGASRGRLLGQFFTEGALLSGLGGVCGALLSVWFVLTIRTAAPADAPRIETVRFDWAAAAFAFAVCMLMALAFGVAQALTARKSELALSMSQNSRVVAGNRAAVRMRGLLVSTQIGMTLVLLVAAALVAISLRNLEMVPLGFDPHGVLTAQISLQGQGYQDPKNLSDFYRRLRLRLESSPGIIAAGAILIRPLEGQIGWDVPYAAPGQSTEERLKNPVPNFEVISPGYFGAMGIPIVAGRDFVEEDGPDGRPATIVSEGLAKRVFGSSQGAVGRPLKLDPADPDSKWLAVTGVVGDARYRALDAPRLDVYVPYGQSSIPTRYLVIRSSGDAASLVPLLRESVSELDSTQAVTSIVTMDEMVAGTLARPKMSALILVFFAVSAAVLAVIGIFGTVTYTMHERAREMGIRMALGAKGRDIVLLALKQGLQFVAVGLAAGLVTSLGVTKAISGLVYGIDPISPLLLAVSAAGIASISLLACYLPARRTVKSDPMRSLNED